MADLILKDRQGNNIEGINDVPEIKVPTSDGGFKRFTHGERVQTTVDPDFSDGDILLTPNSGQVFSGVTVKRPAALTPENIVKDVEIAGVVGTSAGGGGIDALLTDSLTTITSDVEAIAAYAIYQKASIHTIDLPMCETAGEGGISHMPNLVSVNMPKLKTSKDAIFSYCDNLTYLKLDSLETIEEGSGMPISYNPKLEKVDFPSLKQLPSYLFYSCAALTAVILRSTTIVGTYNDSWVTNTGQGAFSDKNAPNAYIYVPSALVSSYRNKTQWANVKTKIRAIEDYPEICGTT